MLQHEHYLQVDQNITCKCMITPYAYRTLHCRRSPYQSSTPGCCQNLSSQLSSRWPSSMVVVSRWYVRIRMLSHRRLSSMFMLSPAFRDTVRSHDTRGPCALSLQLAGMWEFCRGPAGTFGAVAFTSYGGFWLSFAYFFSFIRKWPVQVPVVEACAVHSGDTATQPRQSADYELAHRA